MRSRLLFSLFFSLIVWAGYSQTSIGIIGTATPGGWDTDTDLTQDPANPDIWSIVMNLTQGDAKFRQDNAWDINWGDTDFPVGIGTQGGPNIPVPAPGEYTITFNSATGEYSFVITSDIGILGSATPGGWDTDWNMIPDPADSTHNQYFTTINLIIGEAKFRQNDAWDVNWGDVAFPTGIGTQGGPNIPIAAAGKYNVTFNKATGAYNFEEVVEFESIGLIGSATPGGWDVDTNLVKDPNNPNLWTGTFDLLDGEAKFRANDAWAINWGGTNFPVGIGVLNSNDNIPVTAGRYLVSFNTETFEYKFLLIGNYSTIGIIGDATPGGWDNDTDMIHDPADESKWYLRLILTDGEAQFRADNEWTVNWGGGTFPSGVAELNGPTIPVTAGEYIITFNSTTGEYNFELLVIYNTVGLVGTGTPLMSWDTDVDMTKDAVDESFWYINSIDLVDGECKFRAEDAWTVNWGLADFPTGIGVQGGPNILVTAGTYRVTLNSGTGEYAFTDPSSTIDLLRSDAIAIAPNPAFQTVNINVQAKELQGDVNVILFDQQGRQVIARNMNIQQSAKLDVSGIAPGQYLLHLSNGKYIVGKKVTIVK